MENVLIQWLEFPLFIKWYITSKCNLRCTHCYLTDYTQETTLDNVLPYIDYFGTRGVKGIVLLGGEPLIRKDLEKIINQIVRIQKIGLKIITNGLLATPNRSQSLIEAGAKQFQVSLEGHNPLFNDSVRGKGTFDKIIEGIVNLKKSGAEVSLAFTITKQNYHSLNGIFLLADSLEIQCVKLSPFVPIGTGLLSQEKYLLTREIVLEIQEKIDILVQKHSNIKVESIFLRRKQQCQGCSTFGCGAGTTTLIINHDWTISACDLLTEEDKTRYKVKKPEDIQDIWTNDSLFKKWRGLNPQDKTPSINSFNNVHYNGCHISYAAYDSNIFF